MLLLVAACGDRSQRQSEPVSARDASLGDAALGAPIEARVAVVPPPSWPRLGHDGIEGLSAQDMMSIAALARAFPTAVFETVDPPGSKMFFGTEEAALIRDDAVLLTAPGMRTVHGIGVGDPLAKVLAVKAPRRCEPLAAPSESQVRRFVRCWVGARPFRFRYVVELERPLFGEGPAIPEAGPALERWIAAADRPIELILWRRDPGWEAR